MGDQNMAMKLSVLVIDDEDDVRNSVADYLAARDHTVFRANDGPEGLALLQEQEVDIVVTDIRMPKMDGFEVLRAVRQTSPQTEVIMVTGFGDIDGAVQAMREGAFDFFTKPLKMRELSAAMERTVRFHALRKERDQVRRRLDRIGEEARRQYGIQAIIGESDSTSEIRELIRRVCENRDTTVLVTGETGTGKELVARAIHHESDRCDGPFVAVDCTAIPRDLMESTFYGHDRGAFTGATETHAGYFEQPDGGTIFLDEVGDMAPEMQARLLRTLEERSIRRVGGSGEIPVDVRVISATNARVAEAISTGQFREDLYHRLNTFDIHIPPLRERTTDIPILAQHFLTRYATQTSKAAREFSQEAMEELRAHHFRGNVRELKNLVERAVIFSSGDMITPAELQIINGYTSSAGQDVEGKTSIGKYDGRSEEDLTLASVEVEAIREALRRCGGNRGKAAEMLGVSRFSLRRRMEQHHIEG